MNQNPQWRFREMSRGEINVDPIEGEFFTTEALGSLSDAPHSRSHSKLP